MFAILTVLHKYTSIKPNGCSIYIGCSSGCQREAISNCGPIRLCHIVKFYLDLSLCAIRLFCLFVYGSVRFLCHYDRKGNEAAMKSISRYRSINRLIALYTHNQMDSNWNRTHRKGKQTRKKERHWMRTNASLYSCRFVYASCLCRLHWRFWFLPMSIIASIVCCVPPRLIQWKH